MSCKTSNVLTMAKTFCCSFLMTSTLVTCQPNARQCHSRNSLDPCMYSLQLNNTSIVSHEGTIARLWANASRLYFICLASESRHLVSHVLPQKRHKVWCLAVKHLTRALTTTPTWCTINVRCQCDKSCKNNLLWKKSFKTKRRWVCPTSEKSRWLMGESE